MVFGAALLGTGRAEAGRGPALTIKNVRKQRLIFFLKVEGTTRWDKKVIAPRASRDYWATNQRSRHFNAKILTRMRSGKLITRRYRLDVGYVYKVKPINGVWDFRRSKDVKGPSILIFNTSRNGLVFFLRVSGSRRWDKKRIAARKKTRYWAKNHGSTAFDVKISTRFRDGRQVSRKYRLRAGFRYKVKPINGVWDFRKY